MSGELDHSAAEVVRNLLINLGLGAAPVDGTTVWPIYCDGEPDTPDSCITVYDTDGILEGREHVGGETQEHEGIQVRVRAAAKTSGYAKSDAIKAALDTQVKNTAVTIGAAQYVVHAVTRTSGVIRLGKEVPKAKRSLFTINALVALTQV